MRRTAIVAGTIAALVLGACADDDTASTTTAGDPTTTTRWTVPPTVPGTDPVVTTTTAAPTTTTQPPAVDPARGGVVVIGMYDEPASINPLIDRSPAADRIAQMHTAGISDVGPDMELVPELLVELPTVANGGVVIGDDGTMTVRYQIVPEARWSDGVPITGADFEFTYEAIRDLDGYAPGHGADVDLYRRIIPESVVAGEETFEFTMASATVQHELLFPVVLPRHQVSGTDLASAWNSAPWASAGPFLLESWVRGLSMTFVRNPAYWKTDESGIELPYLDRVIVRFFPTGGRAVDAFRVREVDVLAPPAAPSVIDAVAELTPDGAAVYALAGSVWEHLSFQMGALNRNPGSLNGYTEFRRAVAHAIDRDAVAAEVFGGYGEPIDSYVDAYRPSVSGGAWARYGYDPTEARRLLGVVCEAEGLPCDIEPPTVVLTTSAAGDVRVRAAEAIRPMLGNVGILVELRLEESALLFGETLLAGTWDVGLWAWSGGPGLAPLVLAHDLWHPGGPPPYGINYQRYGTDAVDGADPAPTALGPVDVNQAESTVRTTTTARFGSLVDRMRTEVDEETLLALIGQAERLLAEEMVFVPLFSRLWVGSIWADEVGGYVPNPALDTWNVERWYRLDLAEDEVATGAGETATSVAEEAAGDGTGDDAGDGGTG